MRIRNRRITLMLAWLGAKLGRMLFATCRKEMYCVVPGTDPCKDRGDKRMLYAVWHDQLALGTFYYRYKEMAALVSRHQDGSYLADAMQILGFATIRGSSSRGGAQALRSLLDEAQNHDITMTPDGPRGPRRVLKSGIVFLASHSEREIAPIAVMSHRYWRIQGSWTDMVIPKPFTKIWGVVGKPLQVPPGLDKEGIEQYRQLAQAEMDHAQEILKRILVGEKPEQDKQLRAAA